MKGLWVIALVGACAFSCKTKKAATATAGAGDTARPLYTKTAFEQWPTPYWSAKAKVSIQHPSMNVGFSMTMRAVEGEALWFSANAFGIMEVARGVVTKDSVFALDKVNNRLYVGGLQGLEQYVPIPMGVSQLQHFLMGRVFWDSLVVANYQQAGDSTFITGNEGDIAFASKVWLRYFLQSVQAQSNRQNMSFRLENSQFKPNRATQVAYRKSLRSKFVEDGKEVNSGLDFDFSKFEFADQRPEMPFDFPSDAERVKLN